VFRNLRPLRPGSLLLASALAAGSLAVSATPANAAVVAKVSMVNGVPTYAATAINAVNNVAIEIGISTIFEQFVVQFIEQGSGTLQAGSGCVLISPKEVHCTGDVQQLGESIPVRASLGEGHDFAAADVHSDFLSGAALALNGNNGNDTLGLANEDPGNAYVNLDATGGEGRDTFLAGAHNGTASYIGGNGTDTISYLGRTEDITVNLDGFRNDGPAGDLSDNVRPDVETVFTGFGNDTLVGSNAPNLFIGSTGADTFDGLGGSDTVSYANSPAGVVADIDGAADDGAANEGDNIATTIEKLVGSAHADILTGSNAANTLEGGIGNDILDGGPGADRLIGGTDIDTASYATRTAQVTVTLDNTSNDGGFNEKDNVQTENITGGTGPDVLKGDRFANILRGGAGADRLTGNSGNDELYGEAGNDPVINGGEGTDLCVAGADGGTVSTTCELRG
jgi:Ca2+-binding RTX toxin-like protein